MISVDYTTPPLYPSCVAQELTERPNQKTFPHKIAWQSLAAASANAIKIAYKQLAINANQNGNGTDELYVSTGTPFPSHVIHADARGTQIPKNDGPGVAIFLVAVPASDREDALAFASWMTQNAKILIQLAKENANAPQTPPQSP